MSTVFILSKLFAYLVLPPGMFILAFLFFSIFGKSFRRLALFCALGLYALSNHFVANALLSPLEMPYNHPLHVKTDIDAVVVLGGGSMQGVANLPLHVDAYKRMAWGMMLAKNHNLPLLFTGGGLNAEHSEALAFNDATSELMSAFSITPQNAFLHVKTFSIHTEDKSLDTYENALFSKRLFEQSNLMKPRILLVTSAYHMKRSVKLFEHAGFDAIPCATDFKQNHRQSDIWDYLPNMSHLFHSYIALREYVGLLSLKLRGI